MLQDLILSLRMLRGRPVFTVMTVLTLALGIGANSALFSMANALLLRPIPYQEPERLVRLFSLQRQGGGGFRGPLALPEITALGERTSAFEDVAALTLQGFNLSGGDEPVRVQGARISANLFSIVGRQPAVGRVFTAEEEAVGGARVAVLSHGLWERAFGSDPEIVDRVIRLDDEPYFVVGVLPRFANYPYNVEVFLPLERGAAESSYEERIFSALGRLRQGVPLERARREAGAIAARLEAERPDTNSGRLFGVVTLRDDFFGGATTALAILWVVAFLLLVLVCANVTNLLLQRAVARYGEFAIRRALGAGRSRVFSQILLENLLLAAAGAVLGLGLAGLILRFVTSAFAGSLIPFLRFEIDGRVVLFTLLVTVLVALAVGLVPTLRVLRLDLRQALGTEGRSATASGSRRRLRGALVVTQIALSLAPLIAGILLVRSYQNLRRADTGFDRANLLTLQLILPEVRYPRHAGRALFFDQLRRRLEALPGTRGAAWCWAQPFTEVRYTDFAVEGQSPEEASRNPAVGLQIVSPSYFETLGLPHLEGRRLTEQDNETARKVALVSARLERVLWPEGSALGKRLRVGRADTDDWFTVVGTVADTRLQTPSDPRASIDIYVPLGQVSHPDMSLLVRTEGDPMAHLGAVKGEIEALDPTLPSFRVATARQLFERATTAPRILGTLFQIFALAAVLVALVGMYGTVSVSIAQRMREFGIRMALGAGRRTILRLVLGRMLRLVLLGVALGVAGAAALSLALASQLFGVGALEPVTFLLTSAVLTLVALGTAYLAARPCARLDPAAVLRAE